MRAVDAQGTAILFTGFTQMCEVPVVAQNLLVLVSVPRGAVPLSEGTDSEHRYQLAKVPEPC